MTAEVLLALVALVGTLLGSGGFVRWWLSRRDAQLEEDQEENEHVERLLVDVHRVYRALSVLLALLPCDRVMVVRVSNGGEIPSLGTPLYASVLYEVHTDHLPPVGDSWQLRRLDGSHVSMLSELVANGRVYLETATMPPSTLRTLYEGQGVVAATVRMVHRAPGALYYLAAQYREPLALTPAQRAEKDSQVARIAAIFRQHSDVGR